LPAAKEKITVIDKNGAPRNVRKWMYDPEKIVEWAANHYDTTPEAKNLRGDESDAETTIVFPEGLELTKRQKRNLAALTGQWNCSPEQALQRMLNIQGHSLGRAINGIDNGELIFLGVNEQGKKWLNQRAEFWGHENDQVVINLLRNTELGPYLNQDTRR
jgi:hypothetical protein